MTVFYGYKRLTEPEDWRGLAGDDKWVAGRSAFELAHAWNDSSGLPEPISVVLDQSGFEVLRGITLNLCLVEKPVFLDTHQGPSMTDLMGYGNNASGEVVVVAVEGKADEAFGSRVSAWVRGDGKNAAPFSPPRPSRVRRLAFLSRHLGTDITSESDLRYQLIHRTVSAVLEAQLHGAAAALVLVHAFGPESSDNWADFSNFINALGDSAQQKARMCGRYKLGANRDFPVYFLWWQQSSTIQTPQRNAAGDGPDIARH